MTSPIHLFFIAIYSYFPCFHVYACVFWYWVLWFFMCGLCFPFCGIVGQFSLRRALVLNAVNPGIGGVLVRGDRGTGKTTAVRALVDLLPDIDVVDGCVFNCDVGSYRDFGLYEFYGGLEGDDVSVVSKSMRVVELPLGATEDRVVGSLDIENALKEGVKALEPGILASANRNVLYVDEINLLDDSLVDVLLDAAAYGVNTVEREGVSVSHPSDFILVGTMNPEEGELRGQLADRIGLVVDVDAVVDVDDRVLIMKRREEFEKDPVLFSKKFEKEQEALRSKIVRGREILGDVEIDDVFIEIIARITLDVGSEGHRSDISILKTSKTIAAFNNRLKVNEKDLNEAITLVLGEDKFLSQRIEKIKKDIEKKSEEKLKEDMLNDKSDETLNESLQNELQKINDKLDQSMHQKEDQNTNKENIEPLDLKDSKSKKSDFVNDSDFKAKDDFDSKINQGEQLEDFNDVEFENGKFDIKKF